MVGGEIKFNDKYWKFIWWRSASTLSWHWDTKVWGVKRIWYPRNPYKLNSVNDGYLEHFGAANLSKFLFNIVVNILRYE
jgi:hypothetical protein